MNDVYVVTYYNIWGKTRKDREPVVTVFNNKEAAYQMYNFFNRQVGVRVIVDFCPVYSHFESGRR